MLNKKRRYLQVALNSSPYEGESIIATLPSSDRIIIEAGTPLIKEYGAEGIRRLKSAWQSKRLGYSVDQSSGSTEVSLTGLIAALGRQSSRHSTVTPSDILDVYVVADTKCMDRGKTEVQIAAGGGASAATVLGAAPLETINYFIESCKEFGIDSMVDFLGVEEPVKILRKLRKMPTVAILHRGVDEETFDRHAPIPYIQINKIRSSFDVMIAIAGGDNIREVQRAIFNGADIVVVWKDFYNPNSNTGILAEQFLHEIK